MPWQWLYVMYIKVHPLTKFDEINMETSEQSRYLAIRNVTLIGVIGNIFLAIIKILFGWLGHSQALIADGLHSLSDLISDGVVLVAAKFSSYQADEDHPYGHGRFETLATVLVGSLLVSVAVWVLLDAGQRVFQAEQLLKPTLISLIATIFSILVKEALYQYTVYVGRRVRSPMLRANAWHHRSDAISSIIVFIGIVGTLYGAPWLDAVAAIGVSFMIGHIGLSLAWSGLRELVDTGLDEEKRQQIYQTINKIDGVRTSHNLRTRFMGSKALVDVHILVNPRISVSEGHQIGENVRAQLIDHIEEVADVLIHVDPENDEEYPVRLTLPLREQLTNELKTRWHSLPGCEMLDKMTFHYLGGKVTVDIHLPLTIVDDLTAAKELSKRYQTAAEDHPQIRQVNIYFF